MQKTHRLASTRTVFVLYNSMWVLLAKLAMRLRPQKDPFLRFEDAALFRHLSDRGSLVDPTRTAGRPQFIVTDRPVSPSVASGGRRVLRSLDSLTDEQVSGSVFHVYFLCDSDALPVLRRIRTTGGSFLPDANSSKTDYRFVNRAALEVLQKTWSAKDRVSHLKVGVHENLCEALELTKGVPGDYVEIGVYKGGQALTALHYLRHLEGQGYRERKAWLLDTFDGFTYPQAESSPDIQWAGTHRLFGAEKTMRYVRETLTVAGAQFELVRSNICEEDLPANVKLVSVANIDVDMYEPTFAALTKTADRVSPGGMILVEDAASTPRLYGAYLALCDFLDTPAGRDFIPIFKSSQYFLIRK